jgi:hypothetical protein
LQMGMGILRAIISNGTYRSIRYDTRALWQWLVQ